MSNLVVIDEDGYKSVCEFDRFMRGRDMLATLIQNSAHGGKHYIFKHNPDDEFAWQLCSDADIKSNGYVLVEPSTLNGKNSQGRQTIRQRNRRLGYLEKGRNQKAQKSNQQDILSEAD